MDLHTTINNDSITPLYFYAVTITMLPDCDGDEFVDSLMQLEKQQKVLNRFTTFEKAADGHHLHYHSLWVTEHYVNYVEVISRRHKLGLGNVTITKADDPLGWLVYITKQSEIQRQYAKRWLKEINCI